jgi:hypothetical protein
MTDSLSESAIVRAVAKEAARHITRKVINRLQSMKHTLSGDDSELKTTWDEICAQVQYEESFYWDAYDETVRSYLTGYVAKLPKHEREAIWLQTDAGGDWDCEEPEDRESNPVLDDDIVDYLAREYIYVEAGRWSNARIRAFIERASMRD